MFKITHQMPKKLHACGSLWLCAQRLGVTACSSGPWGHAGGNPEKQECVDRAQAVEPDTAEFESLLPHIPWESDCDQVLTSGLRVLMKQESYLIMQIYKTCSPVTDEARRSSENMSDHITLLHAHFCLWNRGRHGVYLSVLGPLWQRGEASEQCATIHEIRRTWLQGKWLIRKCIKRGLETPAYEMVLLKDNASWPQALWSPCVRASPVGRHAVAGSVPTVSEKQRWRSITSGDLWPMHVVWRALRLQLCSHGYGCSYYGCFFLCPRSWRKRSTFHLDGNEEIVWNDSVRLFVLRLFSASLPWVWARWWQEPHLRVLHHFPGIYNRSSLLYERKIMKHSANVTCLILHSVRDERQTPTLSRLPSWVTGAWGGGWPELAGLGSCSTWTTTSQPLLGPLYLPTVPESGLGRLLSMLSDLRLLRANSTR